MGSSLEKCRIFWKNGHFPGRIWPDWGNSAWANMVGLRSIGIIEPHLQGAGRGLVSKGSCPALEVVYE